MNCAISVEQQKRFLTQVAKDLLATINDKKSFDVKAYMLDVYNKVKEKTDDHERALDYVRLTPGFVDQVASYDRDIKKGMREAGLSFDSLADLIVDFTDDTNGLKTVSDYLELTRDIKQELINDNVSISVTPEPEVIPEEQEEIAPTPIIRQVFDFIGQTLSSLRVIPYTETGQIPGTTDIRLGATPLYDIAYENKDNPNSFFDKVKRNIVKKLAANGFDSRNLRLLDTPVYLTAMSVERINPADLGSDIDLSKDPDRNGVLLVITDKDGYPFRFDDNGNPILAGGKIAYYKFRNPGKNYELKLEDKKRIDNLAVKQYKNNKAAATSAYIRELELLNDMREYIIKDKQNNQVQTYINGGTLGYAVKDNNQKTNPEKKIKDLDFEGQAFNPELTVKSDPSTGRIEGITYFTTEGFYEQPIEIERPTVDSITEPDGSLFKDKLISLLVDPITDKSGKPLLPDVRRDLIEFYIKTSADSIRIYPNKKGDYKLEFKGNALPIETTEQRAQAKQILNTYFSTYSPLRKVKGPATGLVKDTYTVADLNKVVQIKEDGVTGFFVIEKPKVHVRGRDNGINYLKGNFNDIRLSADADGNVIMEDNMVPYSNFIKNNFAVRYVLQGNKIRKYDPYFTFRPTDEALDKLYGTPLADEVIEKVEQNPPSTLADTELPGHLPVDDIDTLLKNANADNKLNKLSGQKQIDIKASKEQIEAAKVWFENHPVLGKNGKNPIPFEALFTMVNTANPSSMATWYIGGITLYKGSDYSDLYHEAWHAFTQSFLTKTQKKELYAEVRKKIGSFTDFNGKRVSFKNATDIQIEEYLAEDFRAYMISGGKVKENSPVRNSLFRKILNALKALFSNSTLNEIAVDGRADAMVNELYEKLRVGNLAKYTFDEANVQFGDLNKGIVATDPASAIKALGFEDSKLINDTVSSLLSEWDDLRNSQLSPEEMNIVIELKEKLNKSDISLKERTEAQNQLASYESRRTYTFTGDLLKDRNKKAGDAYRYVRSRIGRLYNAKYDEIVKTDNEATKARLTHDAKVLYWAFTNFGDLETISNNIYKNSEETKGVIGYHMLKTEDYFDQDLLRYFDVEELDETAQQEKGKQFERSGNESSMRDLAAQEIIYLISGLHKTDANNKVVLNRLGAPELVDFSEVWNRIARTLQNTLDIEMMEKKLVEEAKVYPVLQQLLDKLGPLATGELSKESQLWTNFWQSFALARIPLVQMTLEKNVSKTNDITYQSNIGEAFNSDTKVGRRWEAEFHTYPDERYVKHDKTGYYLNLSAVIDAFSTKNERGESYLQKGKEREFLHAIGWKIGDNPKILEELAKQDDVSWIYNQLKYLRARKVIVRNFEDITKAYEPIPGFGPRESINGRFKRVQRAHARYSDEASNFMVSNAEGNTQFEHSLNNTLTIMVNSINNAPTYDAMIALPHMANLDVTKNPFAASSIWLDSIFDMSDIANGRPKRKINERSGEDVKIHFTNLSGVLLKDSEDNDILGVSSASADEVTKLILDFHLTAQMGQPELMRHADKSTSYSAYIRHIYTKNRAGISDKYINNEVFLKDPSVYNGQAYALLIGSINAEYKRIGIMKNLKDPSNIDFKYYKAGQDFTAFDDVLTAPVKKEIKSLLDTVPDLESYLNTEDGASLKDNILNDISNYFEKQVASVTKKFDKNPFIADNVYKDIFKEAGTRENAKKALIKSYVYNSWINNIETIKLFYGDLALYNHKKEEFHKRNAGMGSTGTIYRSDRAMQNIINNGMKRDYANTKVNGYGAFNGKLESAIIKDNNIKSVYYDEYLKSYIKHFMKEENLSKTEAEAKAKSVLKPYDEGGMNEGDAQGWISFDSYRILKTTEGTWGPNQQKLYDAIVNGEPVNSSDVLTFFPTIKAQYFGPLENTIEGLPITAMHKFSLFPLIPTVIKGTNLQTLHEKMMKEGIDYALFESGSKVGTVTKKGEPDDFYTEGRKEISTEPFTKNTIFLNYLKNQLEIAPKFKKNVIFSTQLRKLIEDGLMDNGVPTDFEKGSSADVRIRKWNALPSEEAKLAKSPRYTLLKAYENNIKLLTDIKKRELIAELNWQMKIVNGSEEITGNIEDLIIFVKKELTRQDLADHELDFLATKNGKLKNDLSLSLNADKIEKLLNALVVKRLVKQKVKGEGLIQLSGALLESFASTDRNYKNPTESDLAKWGTNDLPTYRQLYDKKGNPLATTAMKVKIALQGDFEYLLDAVHIDGQRINTIERLNEMVKNEDWLNTGRNRDMITMVGVRIPVQGLNSMEFMEVYEFLPKEAGNIIVPPAEIVAKSGSDFDIDKLSVMMPNLKKGTGEQPTRMFNYTKAEAEDAYRRYVDAKRQRLENKEVLLSLSDDDINTILEEKGMKTKEQFMDSLIGAKAVENDLIGNIRSILELPENFVNLTQPNSTDIVKDIADELASDVMTYNPTDVINGEKRTFVDPKGKEKVMISPTRALEIEYNIYKHVTNNIGKQTLGLGAVDNTYNTIFNRIGFHLNATAGMSTTRYNEITRIIQAKDKAKKITGNITDKVIRDKKLKAGLSEQELKDYFQKAITKDEKKAYLAYHKQTLLLPHNKINVMGEEAISLAYDKDANNEYRIADIINQLLNGWVDIAKDTWIFNIQGNKEVAPVLLFLLQAGVPVKDAIYFSSMPLVRAYVNEQRLAKGTFAEPLNKVPLDKDGNPMPNFFKNAARDRIVTNPEYGFNFGATEIGGSLNKAINKRLADVTTNFDKTELRARISDFAKNKEYKYTDLDRMAFLHFLQAENMATPIRDIKLKMNFDTSKSGTLFEAQNRILMKDALKEDSRFPVEMVDRILNDSPIGAFYVQPFQLAIWKDLFPLRNHPAVNNFLLGKFEEGVNDDIKRTFGDKERFANEFRNDLVSFIFQNNLRDFDQNADTYKGYEVKQELYVLLEKLENAKSIAEKTDIEKQIASLLEIPVKEVTLLKQGISRAITKLDNGAYALGNQLYVDKVQLQNDYVNKLYTKTDYTKRGLAKVNSQAFETADEYYNFVYEREILRKTYPYSLVKDSIFYKQTRNFTGATVKQKEGESSENYNARLDKIAYERFLRDKALLNTFNHWALFKSDNTYADQFNIISTAYADLLEAYPLIKQLAVDSKSSYTNLKLKDNMLDSDMLNVLHENLLKLMDYNVQKVENDLDNRMITEFFNKLPIVAFLQSGMNTKSSFSLTRLVPQDIYLRMMEKPVVEFVKHLSKADDSNLTPPIMERYYDMFVSTNSFKNRLGKIRGKKLNSSYKLAKSIKDLGKEDVVIQEEVLTPDTRLVSAGASGLFMYRSNMLGLKSKAEPIGKTEAIAKRNLDKVFIYNYAVKNQNNATTGDATFFQPQISNAIGLPTRLSFSATNMEMTDVDGKISEENRIAIEDAITAIKEAQADGKSLVFNKDGYGQYMIGEYNKKTDIAKETFLYLSKRLFEEFNFINPKYLATEQAIEQIQSGQPISDALVLDFMQHCM